MAFFISFPLSALGHDIRMSLLTYYVLISCHYKEIERREEVGKNPQKIWF